MEHKMGKINQIFNAMFHKQEKTEKEFIKNPVNNYAAPVTSLKNFTPDIKNPDNDQNDITITLEITDCEDENMIGKRFEFNKFPVTIGRNGDNDLRLSSKDISVSRYHAKIELQDGFIVIQDSGSTYGTLVNNRNIRTESVRLKNDDVIKIGRVRIRFITGSTITKQDEEAVTYVGFHLANATLMADTERGKIRK